MSQDITGSLLPDICKWAMIQKPKDTGVFKYPPQAEVIINKESCGDGDSNQVGLLPIRRGWQIPINPFTGALRKVQKDMRLV